MYLKLVFGDHKKKLVFKKKLRTVEKVREIVKNQRKWGLVNFTLSYVDTEENEITQLEDQHDLEYMLEVNKNQRFIEIIVTEEEPEHNVSYDIESLPLLSRTGSNGYFVDKKIQESINLSGIEIGVSCKPNQEDKGVGINVDQIDMKVGINESGTLVDQFENTDAVTLEEEIESIRTRLNTTKTSLKQLRKEKKRLRKELKCKEKEMAESVIEKEEEHALYECNMCQLYPIQGKRFNCIECHDYDLCGNCEKKFPHNHNMIRYVVPETKPVKETETNETDLDNQKREFLNVMFPNSDDEEVENELIRRFKHLTLEEFANEITMNLDML